MNLMAGATGDFFKIVVQHDLPVKTEENIRKTYGMREY